MRFQRVALPAVLALLTVQSLDAQQAPRRPRLGSDADTNDPVAYFNWGRERLERFPDQAYAAFYWTHRLEPGSPQALYGMWVAQLLRDPRRLVRYIDRDRRTLENDAVMALDSLRLQAEMQDPFFHRGMDELLLLAYAKAAARNEEWFGRSEDAGSSGIVRRTEMFFEETDPYSRGRLYYSQGVMGNALQYYTIALRNRDVDWLWVERGRLLAEVRRLDSARIAIEHALGPAMRDGAAMPHHVFESRAAWQYALGRIHEDRRDTALARIAYEEAIHNNAGYFPANFRLGVLALQQRDTASARFRFGLATTGDRPWWVLTAVAAAMQRIGPQDTVLALLDRATRKEPAAAAGWLLYGQALASANRTPDAIRAYERYLELAPNSDVARAAAAARLAALRN